MTFPVSFNGRHRGRCLLVPAFSSLLAALILKTTAAVAQNAAEPQQAKPGSQPLPQISVSGQRPVERVAIKRRHVDLIPQYSTELVMARVDVIATAGDETVRAVQQATKTIPIVALVGDMLGSGS